MKRRTRFIYLCLIAFVFIQTANSKTTQEHGKVIWHDVRHFIGLSGALLQSPFSFDKAQWRYVACSAAGVAFLTPFDGEMRAFSRRSQSDFNDILFSLDRFYGSKYTLALPLGIYGFGLVSKQDAVRMTGLRALEAFVWAGGVNYMLKVLIGRRRPDAGDSPYFFKPFQWLNDDFQAFPSGHTTTSFAVSTVMAASMDAVYWKIFWYGAAGLVAGARIYHNRHWLADVFAGAALGYGIGRFVSAYKHEKKLTLQASRIQPLISFNRIGLTVRF